MARNLVPSNLGLVVLTSYQDRYLQAHGDNGEIHASKRREEGRGTEETWYLYAVDPDAKIYGLQNWASQAFLEVMPGNPCGSIAADHPSLDERAEWIVIPGGPYGASGAIALVSAILQSYLYTNPAGQNDAPCNGGEVFARMPSMFFPGGPPPPHGNSSWPGWWKLQPATPPNEGVAFPWADAVALGADVLGALVG